MSWFVVLLLALFRICLVCSFSCRSTASGSRHTALSSFSRHSVSCVLRHLLFASFTQVFGCLALPRIWVVIFRARVSVSQSWNEEQYGTLLMYSKILKSSISPYIVPEVVPANSGGFLHIPMSWKVEIRSRFGGGFGDQSLQIHRASHPLHLVEDRGTQNSTQHKNEDWAGT